MLRIIVVAITIGLCAGLVLLGVLVICIGWLVLSADLETMTAPLTPAEREAVRKEEELGVGTQVNQPSAKSEGR